MKKRTILALFLVAASSTMLAQTRDGGISASMLQQIEQSQSKNPAYKALANAIASNKIDDLAKNYKNLGEVDTYFSIETPKQNIEDQKSSGRCWMFSGLNVLRANFAKAHGDSVRVEFSHSYLFFYDQLEKANLMLQGVIDCARKPMDDTRVQFFFRNPIGDGGTFCGVADLTSCRRRSPATTPHRCRRWCHRSCASLDWNCAVWSLTVRDLPTSKSERPRCSARSITSSR